MKRIILTAAVFAFIFSGCSKKDSAAIAANSNLNNRAVGASARDFLSASTYNSINIQLQYMPGYAPNAAALDSLRSFFGLLLNKPGGISINQSPIAASGKSVLTIADVDAIEAANRNVFTSGNTLGVYILYADAGFSTANVLGAAYKNTSLVMFGPTIYSNSGGINQPSRTKLEAIVQEHEFGHLFGLANLGTAMVNAHEDGAHTGHCNNSSCLMYYSTNTTSIGGIIMNSPLPMLDANCRADLSANGGK